MVVVTGISSGIGEATARKFVNEGFSVIGTTKDGASNINSDKLTVVKLDLRDSASIQQATDEIKKAGDIDILVNNAGVWDENSEGEVRLQILRETLEVNLIGLIDFTERLVTDINSGGRIINISSGMGLLDYESGYAPEYQISKAALNKYTIILANRMQSKGVGVVAVNPGWVKSKIGGPSAPRKPEEAAQDIFNLTQSDVKSGKFYDEGHHRTW